MSGEWRVAHDPNDSWYEYRVYEGDTLILNIPHCGEIARGIAEQIIREHNAAEAQAATIERLREALRMERDLLVDMIDEGWAPADLPPRWWDERVKHMNAALTATAGGDSEGQG